MVLTDPPYNVAYGSYDDEAEAGALRRRPRTIANDDMGDAEFEALLTAALGNAMAHLREGGAWYVWHADANRGSFLRACDACGMEVREVLVWVKSAFAPGRQDYQWQHEPCLYGWKGGAAHWFAPTRSEATVREDGPDYRHMSKPELVRLVGELLEPSAETDVLRYDKPASSALHPTMKPVRLFARLIRNSSRPGDVVLDPFGGSGTTLVACEQMGRRARLAELDPRCCDVIVERWERLTGGRAERVTGTA